MKIVRPLKLLCISASLSLICGCKKYSKELTTVNFHLFNPVTNEPYVGVSVKIIQDEDVTPAFQLENEYESTVIWEGKTDANGKASASFKVYKKDKFAYWHYVDESFTNNRKVIKQPDYGPLQKDQVNNLVYKVVGYTNYVRWIKNIDCFDSNDKCRYRYKSISTNYGSWSSWKPITGAGEWPDGYYSGCFEHVTPPQSLEQDIWDVEREIIKNGVTTIERDTFYITGQNGTETLKIFY